MKGILLPRLPRPENKMHLVQVYRLGRSGIHTRCKHSLCEIAKQRLRMCPKWENTLVNSGRITYNKGVVQRWLLRMVVTSPAQAMGC